MPPENSSLNASQAVERIREIIVGRHLERLEQRVVRLEASDIPAASYPELDERLLIAEARVEALQESISRLTDHTRDEFERRHYFHREDMHRLSSQIQQLTTSAPAGIDPETTRRDLEQKLGVWLASWKTSIQQYLEARDRQLSGYLQNDLGQLQLILNQRIEDLEKRWPDDGQFESHLGKIIEAARVFAISLSQIPSSLESENSP